MIKLNSDQKAKPAQPTAPASNGDAVDASDGDLNETRSHGPTIVGMGSSAGGLEAYEAFFSILPAAPGCAFVAVMHLDPEHGSMLPELLGRTTGMPVVQVTDGMLPEADRVHVPPPDTSLVLQDGLLRIAPPHAERSMRRPIDELFFSLADEKGTDSIGVLFSGTGSDGVQGLREIKGSGGIAMVQDPETAKYDSAPAAALLSKVVDISLPPAQLAERLLDILKNRDGSAEREAAPSDVPDELDLLLSEVHGLTGNDLSCYKRSTVSRRIEKRMLLRELTDIGTYRRLLAEDPDEMDGLLKEMLISVTGFFRDEEFFSLVRDKVLPQLFENKAKDDPVRIWIPGCATGEEAYSLAMTVASYMTDRKVRRKIQIFATDLDEDAIAKARSGKFPHHALRDVPEPHRTRYFHQQNGFSVVSGSIREMVVFARHDLITTPPFFRLDIISCRNLLIYFTPEMQQKILPLFFYSLNPEGHLLLGPSESLGDSGELFEAVDAKWKIFRRKNLPASRVRLPISTRTAWKLEREPDLSPAHHGDVYTGIISGQMLDMFDICGVLLSSRDEVLQVLGDVHDYLGLPPGEPTSDVFKMARGHIRLQLRLAVHKARQTGESVAIKGIAAPREDRKRVDLLVHPMEKKSVERSRLIVAFRKHAETATCGNIPMEVARDLLVHQIEEELRLTEEKLKAMIESSETANEELTASNEELMSMNEELQSTNEELETSQEELQALNEELSTVNSELHAKIAELDEAKDDLENLLRSTDIATIFIDRRFVIRQFTPAASRIFNLVENDIGRPLKHFASKIQGAGVLDDARRVLANRTMIEKELCNEDGKWFLLRIFPYRTIEGSIKGVVLTYVDITERKHLEDKLREHGDVLKARLDEKTEELNLNERHWATVFRKSPALIAISRRVGAEYIDVNPAFTEITGYRREELLGGSGPKHGFITPECRDYLEELLEEKGHCENMEALISTKSGDERETLLSIERLEMGMENLLLTVGMDITERRHVREQLEEARIRAEKASVAKGRFLANMSHEIRTPLTGMLGMVSMLAKSEMTPENRKYFEGLQKAGESLKAIIDDILDLSKIEAEKMETVMAPFELRSSLNSVATLFESMARDRGLRLETSFSDRVPDCVETDEGKLQQVVRNLLSNAIKFTPEGRVAMHVDYLLPDSSNPELILTVSDTGIGIPEDKIDSLFQDFEQLDASYVKQYGGTGLGLSICKRLLKMLGGAISVQSEQGTGTVFTATLPAPSAECALKENKPRYSEDFCSGMHILVAEDNEVIKLIMGEMLASFRCSHRIVSNGREALEALEKETFDMVLMDVNMPVMDGITATEAIRSTDKRYRDIPIVALTAYAMKEDVDRILAKGMNAHLAKPITFESLFEMLARFRLGVPEPPFREQAAPPVPRRNVLLDAESLDKSFGDNLPLLDELAAAINEEGKTRLALLRGHVSRNEYAEAANLTHSMGGSAAILGLNQFSNQCLELERMFQDSQLPSPERLDDLRTLFEDSMASLHLWREDRTD